MLNIENTVGTGRVVGVAGEKETGHLASLSRAHSPQRPCVGDTGSLVPCPHAPPSLAPEAIVLTLSNPFCWRPCPRLPWAGPAWEC